MNDRQIFVFGDSWAAGAELLENEMPFSYWMHHTLNLPYINYGRNGASLGTIVKDLLDNIHKITSDDLVVLIVPPDIRWYSEDNGRWYDLTKDLPEWKNIHGIK